MTVVCLRLYTKYGEASRHELNVRRSDDINSVEESWRRARTTPNNSYFVVEDEQATPQKGTTYQIMYDESCFDTVRECFARCKIFRNGTNERMKRAPLKASDAFTAEDTAFGDTRIIRSHC